MSDVDPRTASKGDSFKFCVAGCTCCSVVALATANLKNEIVVSKRQWLQKWYGNSLRFY